MRTVLYLALLTLVSVLFTWNYPLHGHESTLGAYVASLDEDEKDSPNSDYSKTDPTCRLTVNLVDAATKTPVAGMIRLRAADGTVRKLFAESKERNAIHASDSPDNAAREIEFFFPDL